MRLNNGPRRVQRVDRGIRVGGLLVAVDDEQAAVRPHPLQADGPHQEPADDARFVDVLAHSLEHLGGYSPEEAKRVAGAMVPDVSPYDPAHPVAYPDNGRLLTDDVVDPFMAILTNGKGCMLDNALLPLSPSAHGVFAFGL